MRVLERIQGSVVGSISTLVPAVLHGVWAGRRRLLDELQPHRRFLQRVAVLGLALAAAVGFGESLLVAPPSEAVAVIAGLVQTLTGFAGGWGYAAIAGLVAIRVQRGAGRIRRWPR